MTLTQIRQKLFSVTADEFEELSLHIFRYQAEHVGIYKQYLQLIHVDINQVDSILKIPFLPISFFKTHQVLTDLKNEKALDYFQSSGTSGQTSSKHWIYDIQLYEESFMKSFEMFFGKPGDFIILGLLPSYIEQGHSSLVYMVNRLIQDSGQKESGFYLHNYEQLHDVIEKIEREKKPCLLFGVTYALIEFAEQYPSVLNTVQIIETGGMKGRQKEWTRQEVHAFLSKKMNQKIIFSEYGMTELFSQAYSKGYEIFDLPPWMKVIIRDLQDPFEKFVSGKGGLNIIDLANLYSCSFIASEDVGEVFGNGQFKVNGRLDHSDIRGCSLLSV